MNKQYYYVTIWTEENEYHYGIYAKDAKQASSIAKKNYENLTYRSAEEIVAVSVENW